MTVSQGEKATPAAQGAPRNGRWAGYWQLLLARLRELKREPEVVFWVFGFPLLLAAGLGVAFRSKPVSVAPIAVVAGDRAPATADALARVQGKPFSPQIVPADQAGDGFRLGKFDLIVEPKADGGYTYRDDPARPETLLARSEVNEALQASAGRKEV